MKKSKADIYTPAEAAWESQLGENVEERMQNVGKDSRDWRQLVHLEPVNKDKMTPHTHFIHDLGAEVLKGMYSEEHMLAENKATLAKHQAQAVKTIKKRIKVNDFEDGGISVAMEQDWDTSTWSDNMVEAGFEVLLSIFYQLQPVSYEKKDRALQMMVKLLERHKITDIYLRKNVDMLLGQK